MLGGGGWSSDDSKGMSLTGGSREYFNTKINVLGRPKQCSVIGPNISLQKSIEVVCLTQLHQCASSGHQKDDLNNHQLVNRDADLEKKHLCVCVCVFSLSECKCMCLFCQSFYCSGNSLSELSMNGVWLSGGGPLCST